MTPAEQFLAENEVTPRCDRWTAKRKAALLNAMARWPEEEQAIMSAYGLGVDEVAGWRRAADREGVKGLQAKNVLPTSVRLDVGGPPPHRGRSAPARRAPSDPWRDQ